MGGGRNATRSYLQRHRTRLWSCLLVTLGPEPPAHHGTARSSQHQTTSDRVESSWHRPASTYPTCTLSPPSMLEQLVPTTLRMEPPRSTVLPMECAWPCNDKQKSPVNGLLRGQGGTSRGRYFLYYVHCMHALPQDSSGRQLIYCAVSHQQEAYFVPSRGQQETTIAWAGPVVLQ